MSTTTSQDPEPFDRPPERTATAGTLRIELWYAGREPEPWPDRGSRHRYTYRITEPAPSTPGEDGPGSKRSDQVAVGRDLCSGVGAPVDPDEVMRALVAFLSACGEAHAQAARNPSTPSENLELFPPWLAEAAHHNISELAMLELDLDPDIGPEQDPEAAFLATTETPETSEPLSPWPPATWYDIVFLQGDEGHQAVDLISDHGAGAAIEYLSAWDYGTETRDAAMFHDHVYDTPPDSVGSDHVTAGDYALVWHAGLGHVNLLRRFDVNDEPPAFWSDRVARFSPQVPKNVSPTPLARQQDAGGREAPGM